MIWWRARKGVVIHQCRTRTFILHEVPRTSIFFLLSWFCIPSYWFLRVYLSIRHAPCAVRPIGDGNSTNWGYCDLHCVDLDVGEQQQQFLLLRTTGRAFLISCAHRKPTRRDLLLEWPFINPLDVHHHGRTSRPPSREREGPSRALWWMWTHYRSLIYGSSGGN